MAPSMAPDIVSIILAKKFGHFTRKNLPCKSRGHAATSTLYGIRKVKLRRRLLSGETPPSHTRNARMCHLPLEGEVPNKVNNSKINKRRKAGPQAM